MNSNVKSEKEERFPNIIICNFIDKYLYRYKFHCHQFTHFFSFHTYLQISKCIPTKTGN